MRFGDRIKFLREEKNIDRNVLAQLLSVSYSAISKYETNSRNPDNATLNKLAEYFNVTTDYLLGRTDIRNPYIQEQPKTKEIPYYELNEKDMKKLDKIMDVTMAQAKYNLHSEDVQVDEDSMQKVEIALRELFAEALTENKKKFTPKKYRKNKIKEIEN